MKKLFNLYILSPIKNIKYFVKNRLHFMHNYNYKLKHKKYNDFSYVSLTVFETYTKLFDLLF